MMQSNRISSVWVSCCSAMKVEPTTIKSMSMCTNLTGSWIIIPVYPSRSSSLSTSTFWSSWIGHGVPNSCRKSSSNHQSHCSSLFNIRQSTSCGSSPRSCTSPDLSQGVSTSRKGRTRKWAWTKAWKAKRCRQTLPLIRRRIHTWYRGLRWGWDWGLSLPWAWWRECNQLRKSISVSHTCKIW